MGNGKYVCRHFGESGECGKVKSIFGDRMSAGCPFVTKGGTPRRQRDCLHFETQE